MNADTIIAVIGCVTGVISLAVVFINNVFQVGKQKFTLSNRRSTYYFKADDTTVTGAFNPNYCAVVSVKVTNKSSYPITIDDAYIDSRKNRHMSNFRFNNIEIHKGTGVTWRDSEETASLPLKLDPFETKYFAFAFPFFDESVKEYGKPAAVRITIVTARKNYHLRACIPEYRSLFEHD